MSGGDEEEVYSSDLEGIMGLLVEIRNILKKMSEASK